MSLYPQTENPQTIYSTQEIPNSEYTESDTLAGFDEVINFMENIEGVDLKDAPNFADINQVTTLLANIAEAGMLPTDDYGDQVELAYDIQQLLEDDEPFQYAYSPYPGSDYVLVPALPWQKDIIYCSWLSKKWKQVKHFCKKHKKALLIGAGVLVAATGIALAVMAATASTAAIAEAATAGAAAAASSGSDGKKSPKPDNQNVISVPKENPIIPAVKDVISQSNLPSISENSNEKEINSFKDAVRETASIAAHEILDVANEAASLIPKGMEEIQHILYNPDMILGDGIFVKQSPTEMWGNFIQEKHEKIDEMFSTEYADNFSPEAKENRPKLHTGTIPILPGAAAIEAESLIASGISALERLVPEVEIIAEAGWCLPKNGGGAIINGRKYTEHALERIAPDIPEVRAILEPRFVERAKIMEQKLSSEKYHEWYYENLPCPRGIPPSVVEAEIKKTGSTNVKVVLNEKGDVVTVMPRSSNNG